MLWQLRVAAARPDDMALMPFLKWVMRRVRVVSACLLVCLDGWCSAARPNVAAAVMQPCMKLVHWQRHMRLFAAHVCGMQSSAVAIAVVCGLEIVDQGLFGGHHGYPGD